MTKTKIKKSSSKKKRKQTNSWDLFRKKKNQVISSNKEWFKNLWENGRSTIEDYYELYRDTVEKLKKHGLETDIDESFGAFDKLWQIYNFEASNFNDAWDEWKTAMWDLSRKKRNED